MKGKKKYIFISIAICVVFFILGAIYLIRRDSAANETVTRFEWMGMLGEQFGIKEYYGDSPYFKDVDSNNPYFAYVQSAVEWEVIEDEDKFNGDKIATGEFIVLTTMRAIGKYKIQLYLEIDKEPDISDYLNIAYANELITEDQLKAGFDREECLAFLDMAQRLNDLVLWKDDFVEATYQENVVELETGNITDYREETGEVWVDASGMTGLSAGDIIVFETENAGLKTAGKIEAIDASSGFVTVGEPSMEEVFDSLIISDIVSFSGEDIANYYHWGDKYFGAYEDMLSHTGNRQQYKVMPMGTASGSVQNAGMAFSLASEKNKIKIKITDNNTGIYSETTLPVDLNNDTEIECSFEITNINVATQAIWRRTTLEYAEVELHTEVVEKVNLNIVSEEIEIPLGEITIPVAYGLASVDLQLSLVISAEGGISIEARTPVGTHLCYEKNKGIRQIDMEHDYSEPKIEVSAEIGVMLRPEATLKILMLWDAVDIQLDVGVKAGASLTTHPTQVCAEVFAAFPVVSLEVTVDPLVVAPLSKEWELITKENAPFQWNRHFEVYQDGTSGFVEKCTYKQSDSLFQDQEESTPPFINQESPDPPQSGQEEFEFAKYSTYELPINLRITSPFEDMGEYYVIKGELSIDYTVDTSKFDALREGDTFVMQDKRFVKGKVLAAEDYPDYVYLEAPLPQLYPVYCVEDDATYYIDTRFRLNWGNRYGSDYYTLLYDNPVLEVGSDEGMAAWRVVKNDVGESEFIIAKDAYITSIAQEGQAFTAEDCYNDHIAIGGYDLPTLSVGGRIGDAIDCYITFDANGMINYITIRDIN